MAPLEIEGAGYKTSVSAGETLPLKSGYQRIGRAEGHDKGGVIYLEPEFNMDYVDTNGAGVNGKNITIERGEKVKITLRTSAPVSPKRRPRITITGK